jgi:hypothetical protein
MKLTLPVTNLRVALWAAILLGTLPCAARAATDDAALKLSTADGSTQFAVQASNANPKFMVNSAGTIQVTSNTILSGTTFYQNGNAVLGNAATSGQNIVLNGGLKYAVNDLGTAGGAQTFDVSKANVQRIIMNANTTASITNPVAGQVVAFRICQDALGPWTFTWPANVTTSITAVGVTVSRCSNYNLIYDGVNAKFYMMSNASLNQS